MPCTVDIAASCVLEMIVTVHLSHLGLTFQRPAFVIVNTHGKILLEIHFIYIY